MALSEIELQRCKKVLSHFLERRRPPVHLRNQVDIAYRITGHHVELFEVRADWQDASRKIEIPLAKATFVRTRNCWRVFWMRQDEKWHRYEPAAEVASLDAFLTVVDQDAYSCFFG